MSPSRTLVNTMSPSGAIVASASYPGVRVSGVSFDPSGSRDRCRTPDKSARRSLCRSSASAGMRPTLHAWMQRGSACRPDRRYPHVVRPVPVLTRCLSVPSIFIE